VRVNGRQIALLALAAAALLASLAMTARLGFMAAEKRAELQILAESRDRVEALKTPPPPSGLRPLVSGPTQSFSARAGEVFNTELSQLGMTIQSVDTISRRPLSDSLDSLFMTIRAGGDATAGLKALAWLEANRDAVAVESVTAYPGEGARAEWTFKVIVLASRGAPRS
jgi:hypothetical protein